MGLGVDAGDIGDSYMDAPNLPKGGGKGGSGSGWNPISAILDAVGIHLGGKNLPSPKVQSKDGAPVVGVDSQQLPAASVNPPVIAIPTVKSNFQTHQSLSDMGLSLD